MKTCRIILCLLFCLFGLVQSEASSIEKIVIPIETETDQYKVILEKAEREITKKLVSDVLGEENYKKLQSKIEKKIFPKRKKFILLTQILETKTEKDEVSKKDPSSFLTEVLVHFSKETLKKILIQENLFYMDQGANRILALIEFKDEEKRKSYRWWSSEFQEEKEDLLFLKSVDQFYNDLQSVFITHGFFFLHPLLSQYQKMLPKNVQYNNVNLSTAKNIASFFDSQLMILGSITLSPLSKQMNQVVWDIALYNCVHLRKLVHHKARVKVPKNSWNFLEQHTDYWAKNFALQLSSVYEKGTLSTQLFKIEVLGDLNFLERQSIKKSLTGKIKDIKNLREVVIDSKSVQYVADVSKDDKKLLNEIKALKVLDFDFSPYIKSKNHIIIRVKK